MVEIKLANKNEEEYKYDCTIKVSNKTYLTDFEKIIYSIDYKEKIEVWLSRWTIFSYTFHVYIINHRGQIIFTYNAKKPNHEVKEVEAYYNKNHQNVPLIIGFKRDDPGYYTYYTYQFLLKQYRSTGFPENSFQSGDSEEILKQRLQAEDDRVNRIRFTTEDQNKYENYDEHVEPINDKFTKHCFTVKEENRYGDHILSPKRIFELEKDNEIDVTFFSSLNGQYFDTISVYYINETKLELLAEFVNGTNKTYFSRQDKYGYYWAEKRITDSIEAELQKIETESDSKLSCFINKTNPYKGISVVKEDNKSFDKYIHKPELTPGDDNSQLKIALLLYKNDKIKLQPNDSIQKDKLNDLDILKTSSVTAYYELSLGFKKSNDPPLVIELVSTSNGLTDGQANGSNKTYWLKRLDKEGLLWTQFDNKSENIDTEKKQQILNDLNHSSNKSLIVQMELKSKYPIKTIINYKNGLGDKTDLEIQVNVEERSLTSSYKYYEHNLSGSSKVLESKEIVSIRPFIEEIEIKFYRFNNNQQKLEYYPNTHSSKMIYVYFNSGSSVPLLLHYNGKWYGPNKKLDYLSKWNEQNKLNSTRPGNTGDNNQVTQELDKINKRLNEIDLSITKGDGYGIKKLGQNDGKDYYTSPDNNFNGKRIHLNKESGCNKFCKLTHKTSNNQAIGRLVDNDNDLQDVDGDSKKVLEAVEGQRTSITHNSVSGYYHKSDKTNEFPLVIGIFNNNESTNKAFYHRVDSTPQTKWKKVNPSDWPDLQTEGDKLVDKINTIHYTIGKSIVIQVDHQSNEGGSDNSYQVKLVENKDGTEGTTQSAGTSDQITVTRNGCSTTKLTNYTCYKHQIQQDIVSEYVSGLRLYVCNVKLETCTSAGTSLPIHYNPNNKEVKVYFYGNGTSGNTPVDKIPLLVEYEGIHYRPKSRDDYFTSWVKADVSGTEEARGDLEGLSQIGNVLEQINKELNTIQLDNIGAEGSNTNYGLTKPSDSNNCGSGTPIKEFCKRVTVTRDGQSHKDYYLMVTHKTVNKGPIGPFKYREQTISGIKTSELGNGCSQVQVYYRVNDKTYNHPLLILISSQRPAPVTICTEKWFSRMGVDINNWNEQDNNDGKFTGDTKIKGYLEQIQTKLSNYLFLDLSKQSKYSGLVQQGTEGKDKKPVGNINVEPGLGEDTYKPDNYRFYIHGLFKYYGTNKADIVRQLNIQDQVDNFTLQVRLYIFNNYSLGLLDKDGRSTLTPPLTYGKDQATRGDEFNPYVYFFEPGGYGENTTDRVPLLVKFGQNYFGPIDKKSYFEKWQQYNIDAYTGLSQQKEKIKATLNHTTRLLNEIKLETNTNTTYGNINFKDQTNPLQAPKRVSVTRNSGKDYNSVTHSTANTGCVGSVYYGGQELQIVDDRGGITSWSQAIETEFKSPPMSTAIYNDLTVYYHKTNSKCTNPLLIKISGDGGSGRTRVDNLYYERLNSTDNKKWKKVNGSLRDHDITQKVYQIFYNFNKSVKIELANPGQKGYLAKLITNDKDGTPVQDHGSGRIDVENHKKCSVEPNYTCIKHSVAMNSVISSQVGGLRFYFGNTEAKTYKDSSGSNNIPIYYYTSNKNVHVYFHSTNSTIPLMFRYNSQCFRPMDKSNYFTKWVHDSSISGKSHPQPSKQLDFISEMLNEINLENRGQDTGGEGKQYGLTTPREAGTLDKFDGNRITATRTSGDKFGKVTHTTNNNLGIGKVMFGGTDVTDNSTSSKNLGEAVNQDSTIAGTTVNEVTVFYHTIDSGFTTPLMLGFGNKHTGVSETPTVTKTVFYQRENKQDIGKWVKVSPVDSVELVKTSNEDATAKKLNEIRYNIGRSVVIFLEKQTNGDGVSEEYDVHVVDNKSSGSPSKAEKVTNKITITKNCSDSSPPNGYSCFNHKIPELTTASDHQLIGGVKFYVCQKQYLPTFGPGGHPEEHIYYNNKQQTVTVYFYSSGHGPPSSEVDKVPLLVKYGPKSYRPSSRLGYFTSWDRVTVTQGEDDGANSLSTVLDTVNKDLNAVQIDKTGDVGNTSYGLTNPGGGYPCSSNPTFCNRVSAQRDTKEIAHYLKVTHTTFNKSRIGDIYHQSQKIEAIKPNPGTEQGCCNQVTVYYDAKDTQYKTPLLICLGEQAEETPSEPAATTSCKHWYKRNSINITDWVSVEETEEKFNDKESIQKKIQEILNLFKDYLYLEIDNTTGYQPSVQAKTGGKVKVQNVGEGSENNKITVSDASGEEGEGVHVPDDYKGYRHKLGDFYKGAKKQIIEALKKTQGQAPAVQSDGHNHLTGDSGQDTNPELTLRLEIAGQAISLVGQDGKTSLSDPPTLKPTQAESDTDGKKDPIVFFYKMGGGTSGSGPDTVPLLFQFGEKYYGPFSRETYFNTWNQVIITGGGAEPIKTQLNNINRQLNEIDLTQTGTGSSRTSTEYGLPDPGLSSRGFQTKRITVTHGDHVGKAYKTISHTTFNKYNIGSINPLGSCKFDNNHTDQLTGKPHNEAVAVYSSEDTSYSKPQLVLIAESKGTRLGTDTSTVHGYYDLSKVCASTEGKYKFEKVKTDLKLEEITKKEKVKASCEQLLGTLESLGLMEKERAPAPPPSAGLDSTSTEELGSGLHDSADGEEEEEEAGVPDSVDNQRGDSDEGQDDRPKPGPGSPAGEGLGGLGAGTIPGHGASGLEGKDGPIGPRGHKGETGEQGVRGLQGHKGEPGEQTPPPQTERSAPGPGLNTTTTTREVQQPHTTGGAVDGGGNGGGTSRDSPKGDRGETSAQGLQSGGGGGGSGSSESQQKPNYIGYEPIDNAIHELVTYTEKNPEVVYGTSSSVGGVGVIATVGAVVYKK